MTDSLGVWFLVQVSSELCVRGRKRSPIEAMDSFGHSRRGVTWNGIRYTRSIRHSRAAIGGEASVVPAAGCPSQPTTCADHKRRWSAPRGRNAGVELASSVWPGSGKTIPGLTPGA